jgi:hypothetical protein
MQFLQPSVILSLLDKNTLHITLIPDILNLIFI